MDIQAENDRLQHEANNMVANYTRKLEAQDDTIKSLGQRLEHAGNDRETDYEGIYRRENEALKQENKMLRDKVGDLAAGERQPNSAIDALESENRRLRADLEDKEREFSRQNDQMRQLLIERDGQSTKQKNEWAEIYGNMKRETDGLKRDIRMLNKENERLVKQIETTRAGSQGANLRHAGAAGGGAGLDTEKRLKKRELECQALWETLRDLYNSSIDAYDTRQMLDVLARRALDTKAKKKLNLR